MVLDLDRLPGLWAATPARPSAQPPQLLTLLGVHADDRVTVALMVFDLLVDIAELGVPVGMLGQPSRVLTLACELNPSGLGNPTAPPSEPTGCPRRVNSSASVRVDFVVHRNGDFGSPRSSGSINAISAGSSPGSRSVDRLRPAPGARTPPDGSAPAASSRAPRATVRSRIPVAWATARIPPRPHARACAPANSRRCRSSRCGLTCSNTAATRLRSTSTQPYSTRASFQGENNA